MFKFAFLLSVVESIKCTDDICKENTKPKATATTTDCKDVCTEQECCDADTKAASGGDTSGGDNTKAETSGTTGEAAKKLCENFDCEDQDLNSEGKCEDTEPECKATKDICCKAKTETGGETKGETETPTEASSAKPEESNENDKCQEDADETSCTTNTKCEFKDGKCVKKAAAAGLSAMMMLAVLL